MSCCLDKSKRMSVCSSEVCALSEQKSALRTMESLMEDPSRASPIPFNKGDIVSESLQTRDLELARKSEGIQSSEQGNVQITRKTKVEESFVRSQKKYTAEISSSSHMSSLASASSPEMERIMEKKQSYQSYHDTSRSSPIQPKPLQSDRCLTPEIENLMGKPHGSWSPMPAACFVRPISPNQIISFPPDVPHVPAPQFYPRTATPEQFQEARETVERFVDHSKQVQTSSKLKSSQSSGYSQQVRGPRYDTSQQASAFVGRGSINYGATISQDTVSSNYGTSYVNPNSNGTVKEEYCNTQNSNGSGNGIPTNNYENVKEEKTSSGVEFTETAPEPDVEEEIQSDKSSTKRSSVSEEESSRRVFSDFGGPQLSSAVDVESVTEGGIQKTSVTKSQKMEYASCEFESSRKSTVSRGNAQISSSKTTGESTSDKKSFTEDGSKKEQESFSGESVNKPETVTKSQVEEIIKQELNKVFQMGQTMANTNFGEMYEQKSQKSASTKQYTEQSLDSKCLMNQATKKSIISGFSDKVALSGEVITKTGKLTSGLTIAPDRSFTPQALENNYPLPYQNIPSDVPLPRTHPEPVTYKSGYIPLSGDRDTPLLQALTIAPDRPYSPLPTATVPETPTFITAPTKSSMLEALTTAPTSSIHLKGVSSDVSESKSEMFETMSATKAFSSQKYAPQPTQSDFKPIPIPVEIKPLTAVVGANEPSESYNFSSFPPVTDQLKSTYKGTSKAQYSSHSESENQHTVTSSTQQKQLTVSRSERSITPSGLHPPNLLPFYQQNIGEIPLAHRSNSPVPHQIKAPAITPPRSGSVSRQDERRGSVKAMSEAYTQQIAGLNNQQSQQLQSTQSSSSVSYVSSGVYSSGSVTKAYSYEQEHKSIDPAGYHASPLAGKLPLAGEHTLPKCSSPVLGKLDHTKQVFKPCVSAQQTSAFKSTIAEQANLRQAPPYFVQEKEKSETPWKVVKETDNDEMPETVSFKLPPQKLPSQVPFKPSFPSVNKKAPAFPEPSKPCVIPDAGPGGASKAGSTAGTSAPRRGRGILNTAVGAGVRVPLCASCNNHIRGPFITALGKIWCPDHFTCVNANCRRPLQDIGFVEDTQGLYCEYCFEKYLAPSCNKCNAKVKGDCLNAIGKHFHPECFTCAYCGKLFGNSPFFLEDALPYCEADWNELFTTKCFSCGFPIEAGDRWVEALNNNYHSQCFNCTMCKKNLEGQSFFAKGGRPFCKTHAR